MGTASHQNSEPNYSQDFYRQHAGRYAEVSHQFLQSVYIDSSHPTLKTDVDLLNRLEGLVRGRRGLDAGCGAGARDVHYWWQQGYDIYGVDAVEENIREARTRHPDIAERVSVADLSQPLTYADGAFDFVICNAVIQHIPPPDVYNVTLRELARILTDGGVLQLMFKNGRGVKTVYDRDFGVDRSFQLYDEHEIVQALASHGLRLIEAEASNDLGGIMYFTDPKPMEHCVFHARKTSSG